MDKIVLKLITILVISDHILPVYNYLASEEHLKDSSGRPIHLQRIFNKNNEEENDHLGFLFDVKKNFNPVRERWYRSAEDDLPIAKLFNNPDTKIDFATTLNNLGTVTKHTLENKKLPLHHVRNLVGSARDTVLSAMKIAPQNLFIPSKFNIAKTGESINDESDANGSLFHKVGSAIRNGIQSSQDTIMNVGDVTNSAKSALYASQHVVPKIIGRKTNENTKSTILLTPRIFDVHDKPDFEQESDYVKLGHVLDAVGISNPNSTHPQLKKVIFERTNSAPYAILSAKEINLREQNETFHNFQDIVGSTNLKDFFVTLKNEFQKLVNKRKQKVINDEESKNNEEVVGVSMISQPELLHPFMGRTSNNELEINRSNINSNHLGRIVGASNLNSFEHLYNKSAINSDQSMRIADMHVRGTMLKPFMGQVSDQDIKEMLSSYENNSEELID